MKPNTSELDVVPIPRVAGCTPQEISEYLNSGSPVIFEDSIETWAAVGKWKPEFFAESFPDFPLSLYNFTHRDAIPARFPEFVEYLNTGQRTGAMAGTEQPLYLAWNAAVISENAELKEDFDFRPFFGSRRGLIHTGFWMGGVGSHTPLHTDIDSYNLHAVLHGQKHFLLFAPEEGPNLYPSDVYEWSTVFSSVDFRDPDVDRFPKVAQTKAYEGVVEAGELIFIPIKWWHAVTCLAPTTSMNAWLFDKRLLWSSSLYRDLGKRVLHALGLHARGRCTCHGQLKFG